MAPPIERPDLLLGEPRETRWANDLAQRRGSPEKQRDL